MNPADWGHLVQNFGFPLAALIFVLWTGQSGKWVFGREHERLYSDAQEWKTLALENMAASEQATQALERTVGGVSRVVRSAHIDKPQKTAPKGRAR